MNNRYLYKAQIINEETDEVISQIFSYSQEGFEEEMGKSKWAKAIEKYEEDEKALEDISNE